MRKKLKTSRIQNSRLHKKVETLISIVCSLKEDGLMNCDEAVILNNVLFSGSRWHNKLVSDNKYNKGIKYPSELQSFALTLKFYSTKAYDYVHDKLNLALPIYPNTIQTWYNPMDGDPRFTCICCFEVLRVKLQS